MQLGQPAVVLSHRRHRAGLDVRQPLATREHRGTGLLLNHRPQRFLDQVADLAAGPLAVVDLGDPFVDDRVQAQGGGQRFHGAAAAQQWRSHDRSDRQCADPVDECLRLFAPPVVEVDAVGAAGQGVRGVRRRPAVPQQDDCHVAATTPVASRISTTVPSSTR